jgi:DNA-binding NarL/FixJ family response regulator
VSASEEEAQFSDLVDRLENEGMALDADGYLVKPVSPDTIDEKIALIKETWLAEN